MKRWLVWIWLVCLVGCVPSEQGKKDETLPPDLRTRKTGSDWPHFLGPTGDSVSTEKGILSPWPKEGPRIVWQKKLGIGYAHAVDQPRPAVPLRPLATTAPAALLQERDRRTPVEASSTRPTTRTCTATTAARAAAPSSMATASTSSAPRACCTASASRTASWSGRSTPTPSSASIQNFFGVGSTPVVEGNLLHRPGRRQPQGERRQVDFADLKGNGSGIVAFDKHTGKVQVSHHRRTGQLRQPGAGDHRRPPLVLRLRPRRPGRLRPGHRQGRFPLPLAGRGSSKASTPATRWWSATACFISETYGPGSALLEVKPGGCKEVWTDADKARDKSYAVPLDHADPRRRLSLRLQRPAHRGRRAALHRVGHRQGDVARAGPDAQLAAAGRWALHLPGRIRPAAAAEGQPQEVRRSVEGRSFARRQGRQPGRGRRRC